MPDILFQCSFLPVNWKVLLFIFGLILIFQLFSVSAGSIFVQEFLILKDYATAFLLFTMLSFGVRLVDNGLHVLITLEGEIL